jgi:hypothetical protein
MMQHRPAGVDPCFSLLATEYPPSPVHAVPIEAFDLLGRRLL